IRLIAAPPLLLIIHTGPIPQHECDFDDSCRSRRHQRIPKYRLAPAVFGESVDAAPGGDEEGVEEFLRASCAFGPGLADEEEDGCDAPEEHLHPTYHWHYFSDDSVGYDRISAYAGVDPLFEMEFEVDAEYDLDEEEEHEESSEGGMDVGSELATAVGMTEEVAHDGEEGAKGL
ncbi:MAG: hypothetical protein Q9171_005417, partial [Xanthocarpia ochracea]